MMNRGTGFIKPTLAGEIPARVGLCLSGEPLTAPAERLQPPGEFLSRFTCSRKIKVVFPPDTIRQWSYSGGEGWKPLILAVTDMAARLEFCLLGPLVVRCGGREVPVPRGKQRAVLAALLLRANQVVSLDEITETLWGPGPPPSARVTLRNYVRRLRHTLGDAGRARIGTLARGYLISVGASELDVSRFEVLLAAARAASRAASWELAGGHARGALALWRGEPLADVESDLLAVREGTRLAEMWLQALETRIGADLHLSHHAEVITELRRLASAYPLREHLHELLMLALYRDGRRAEALDVYRHARRILVEELGSDPSPGLRDLHQRMLAADPALAAPEVTASGSCGCRLVVPRQLPAAAAHFVGRTRELAALSALLERAGGDTPGMVVISAIGGTAGVGKTALAVHWAHQIAKDFPDGQLYANLRGFDPSGIPLFPARVVRKFLVALGMPADQIPADFDAQVDAYRSMLAGKRMLIVLDNARDADQVRPFLPATSACLVIVTSRSKLAGLVAAEGAHSLTLDVLSATEAHELLASRLGTERVARDRGAADELIRLCARLPLALTIAAARAAIRPGFSLTAVAGELREARSHLDALDPGDTDTSIRAIFSWSCRSLTAPAARMFRLLGVHPGPDISACAAASLAGLAPSQARMVLGELSMASLITEHAPGRFAFHDLLRAYAGEQASIVDGEAPCQAAIHRVLDHYLHTARAAAGLLFPARGAPGADPTCPGAVPEHFVGFEQAWAWLDAEYPVLIAMTTVAVSAGFNAHAWQIPWTLVEFLDRRGHTHDWVATQRIALTAARRLGSPPALGSAHRDLGYACASLGSFDEARTNLCHALDIYHRLGDQAGLGRVQYGLARVFEMQGDQPRALSEAREALVHYRAAGHRGGEARTLNAVGWYYALLGDYRRALGHCEQAIALLRDLGDRAGEADTWDSLGYAHHHLGHHAEALACYARAVTPYQDLGDRDSQAGSLAHIGDTHHAAGDTAAARDAWQQALAILDDPDHPSVSRIRAKLHHLAADPARSGRSGGV
jgi:DNA-binding SARP family transcriptional activator/tetratricopeptide (TPR) repeat protein